MKTVIISNCIICKFKASYVDCLTFVPVVVKQSCWLTIILVYLALPKYLVKRVEQLSGGSLVQTFLHAYCTVLDKGTRGSRSPAILRPKQLQNILVIKDVLTTNMVHFKFFQLALLLFLLY